MRRFEPPNVSELVDTEELMIMFGYHHNQSLTRAIRDGNFPLFTFKHGQSWYAHRKDMIRYFYSRQESAREFYDSMADDLSG